LWRGDDFAGKGLLNSASDVLFEMNMLPPLLQPGELKQVSGSFHV
jgi:hypothetical protein